MNKVKFSMTFNETAVEKAMEELGITDIKELLIAIKTVSRKALLDSGYTPKQLDEIVKIEVEEINSENIEI